MKKLYIVKSQRDFNNIIKVGQVFKNKSFIIYKKSNDLPYSRYGISVGKKLGNAVYRNKYKRKIREIINNYQKKYINSNDYIIILRGNAKNKKYHELNEDFLYLMKKIGKDLKNEEKIKQI